MRVSITQVHNRLSFWLGRVPEKPITITRWAKPVGVLVSPEEYERLRRVQAYLEMLQISRTFQDSATSAGELLQASRSELEARL